MRAIVFNFLMILFTSIVMAQSTTKFDLNKVKFECKPSTKEIEELYTTAFAALKSDEHRDIAGKIFLNILNKDNTMCDAYFWIGVCLTEMKKEKQAVNYYYYADSLSIQSNFIFKRELAEAGIRTGLLGLADEKYTELITEFPNEIEGYLGIAVVSTSNGDIQRGLDNLKIAETKLRVEPTRVNALQNQINLMYGVLYVQQEDYEKAILYLDKCANVYVNLDDWNANYAWATYNLFLQSKDEKWKEASKHALEKLQSNTDIKEEFLSKFNYE